MGSGMVIAFPYPRPNDRNGRRPRARYRRPVGPWVRYSLRGRSDPPDTSARCSPGFFTEEVPCWKIVSENPVDHGTHCLEPVASVGR